MIGTLMGGSTAGGLLCSFAFEELKDWRLVGYCLVISSSLLFITTFIFLEETPKFLMKTKNTKKVCEALNRIGKINTGMDNLVSEY